MFVCNLIRVGKKRWRSGLILNSAKRLVATGKKKVQIGGRKFMILLLNCFAPFISLMESEKLFLTSMKLISTVRKRNSFFSYCRFFVFEQPFEEGWKRLRCLNPYTTCIKIFRDGEEFDLSTFFDPFLSFLSASSSASFIIYEDMAFSLERRGACTYNEIENKAKPQSGWA